MKQFFDLFPVIAFVTAYFGFGKDIILATEVILAASALQVVFGWLLWRKVDRMHLVTLGVLVVFGGLTIVLHDETFIKWKPTIVDIILAGTLLAGQFFGERNLLQRMADGMLDRTMPESRLVAPRATWTRVNVATILFFLGCGALNLYVAYRFDNDTWVNFKLFGITGLNILFMLVLIGWLSRHVQPRAAGDEPPAA